MEPTIETGALIDTRLEEEKQKDWLHEEIAAAGEDNVIWEEGVKYPEYFPYNQASSLSCVAGGGAVTEEHFSKKEGQIFLPSRKDIYIRRVNYPGGGMMLHDLFAICTKGIASEEDVDSQGLGETAMNAQYGITPSILSNRARHYFKNWLTVSNFKDMDTLARIVDHTPVVCFWFFDNNISYQEHWREYPQVVNSSLKLYDDNAAHHQVVLIGRGLINGKIYFAGQDTAGVGTGLGKNKNIRYYSEEFIKARMYAAGYGINALETVDVSKPQVQIKKTLKVGDKGEEVSKLQSVLIYEKLLPIPKPTGLFAGLTLKAVKEYQKRYADDILKPQGLKLPTGFVGVGTIKHINNKYK